jgi:hypothetical protein
MNHISHSMCHRPWHLQDRAFVVDMIIVFITNDTIYLSCTGSHNVPFFGTSWALPLSTPLPQHDHLPLLPPSSPHTPFLFLLLQDQQLLYLRCVMHLPNLALLKSIALHSLKATPLLLNSVQLTLQILEVKNLHSTMTQCQSPPSMYLMLEWFAKNRKLKRSRQHITVSQWWTHHSRRLKSVHGSLGSVHGFSFGLKPSLSILWRMYTTKTRNI